VLTVLGENQKVEFLLFKNKCKSASFSAGRSGRIQQCPVYPFTAQVVVVAGNDVCHQSEHHRECL
jgi:hypothetical protein